MQSMSIESVKNRSRFSCARRRSTNWPIGVSQSAQHFQQVLVGLADLGTEELHHCHHFAGDQDGKAQCRDQALARGDRHPREIRILRDTANPNRLRGRPHPARQAAVAGKRGAAGMLPQIRGTPWMPHAKHPRSAESPPAVRPPTARPLAIRALHTQPAGFQDPPAPARNIPRSPEPRRPVSPIAESRAPARLPFAQAFDFVGGVACHEVIQRFYLH